MKLFSSLLLFVFSITTHAQLIQLTELKSGFEDPVEITHTTNRNLYIVEKPGLVKFIDLDNIDQDPQIFLDIQERVNDEKSEQGLLGICFHPNFEMNGLFYVNYIDHDSNTVIAQFETDFNSLGIPDSEKEILTVSQPFRNHNGGSIKFGPDGFLYFALGDGGAGGDPLSLSQNPQSLLGKIIRIDVDNGEPYIIPEDNPFAEDDFFLDEIWALGLRNPWKFSFDKLTGDLWIGDVGQSAYEEVNFSYADSKGGENYGWSCYEGNDTFSPNGPNCSSAQNLVFPVYTYETSFFEIGCSVTGGYVYRGEEFPALYGKYIFGDFCTGQFWYTIRDQNGNFHTQFDVRLGDFRISSFGEDNVGEMYVANYEDGTIYKIGTNCAIDIDAVVTEANCFIDQDGIIDLNITNSDDYLITWTSGEEGPTLNYSEEGEYCATIVDSVNTCSLQFCVETSSVNIPDFASSLNFPDLSFCNGENVLLGFEFDLPAIWYFNGEPIQLENPSVVKIENEGTYSVQFFLDTCTSEIIDLFEATIIIPPTPSLNYDENTMLLTATNGYEIYEWLKDGQPFMTTNVNQITISESGEYQVLISDELGCKSNASEKEIITISSVDGISDLEVFQIGPNPANDQLNLKLKLYQKKTINIKIINAASVLIAERKLMEEENLDLELNTVDWSQGLYYIIIEIEDQHISRPFIKL